VRWIATPRPLINFLAGSTIPKYGPEGRYSNPERVSSILKVFSIKKVGLFVFQGKHPRLAFFGKQINHLRDEVVHIRNREHE
jgi:hypothetical protein